MDSSVMLVLGGIAFVGLCIIFGGILYFAGYGKKKEKDEPANEEPQNAAGRRRGGLAGLRRRRGQAEGEGGDEGNDANEEAPLTKKQLAKEAKKREREERRRFEEAQLDERKKKESSKEEAYRAKAEARDQAEAAAEAEAAKAEAAAEAAREAEFNEWKGMFEVENEGNQADEDDDESSKDLINEFVSYIKKHKVVVLEELAAEFGIHTQEAVARVQRLQEADRLTGIIDDRGKFIYITQEEMERVADFIKLKGRVRIHELAAESNRLIQLVQDSE